MASKSEVRPGDLEPVRSPNSEIVPAMRSRGLWAQTRTLLLQPILFFRTLPTLGQESRQWLWIAIIILVIIGLSAVRQEALSAATAGDTGGVPGPGVGVPPDMGGGIGVPGGGGGEVPGGVPPGAGGPGGTPTTGSADIGATWTTAIIAASELILGWLILMFLLAVVALTRGRAPNFGHNLQVAIWAALPLALMAGLQLLYYSAGGRVGAEGLSGLLPDLPGYRDLPIFTQAVLLSASFHLTIFWLWNLMLLYLGARFALRGRRWVALFVVVVWVILVVLLPIATGAVRVEPPPNPDLITLPVEGGPPSDFPSDIGSGTPPGEVEGTPVDVDSPAPESTEAATEPAIVPEFEGQGRPETGTAEATTEPVARPG